MIPLVYRQLGDSFPPGGAHGPDVGLPLLVTGALAWVVGRGRRPAVRLVDTHGRIVGFVGVVVAGVALMVVFYAFLLVSLPGQATAGLGRAGAGRAASWPGCTRVRGGVDGGERVVGPLWHWKFEVTYGARTRDGESRPSAALARVAGQTGVRLARRARRPLVAGAAVICPSMGLEAAYSSRALRQLAHRLAGRLGRAPCRLRRDGRLGGDLDAIPTSWPSGSGASGAALTSRVPSERNGWRGGAAARRHAGGHRARPGRSGGRPGAVGPACDGQGVPPRTARHGRLLREQAVEMGPCRRERSRPGPGQRGGSVEAPGIVFSAATAADLDPLAVVRSEQSLLPGSSC